MDSSLYDEFGNYIGPLEESDDDVEAQPNVSTADAYLDDDLEDEIATHDTRPSNGMELMEVDGGSQVENRNL